jgi:uracil-DNA glycosylase family 4
MGAAARQELAEILKQTREYLGAMKEDGVTQVEVSLAAAGRLKAARRPRAAAAQAPRPPAVAASARPAPPPAPAPVRPARPVAPPTAGPAGDLAAKELQRIAAVVAACTKCPLHKERTRTVPGQGHPHPEIMFVGEGPGADEDRTGLAFVGAAGQLLTRMIEAMGLTRDEVFIANIVKCRPPGNRPPAPDEMAACLPYLREQIAALKPRVIVALGATALRGLLDLETPISKLRGQWQDFAGIALMPTFHPAYLLRNPPAKHEVWEDLKAALQRIGRTPPPRPAAPNA